MSRHLESIATSEGSFDDAHVVRFYDDDRELVTAVAAFLVPALSSGTGALVLATASHRAAIERALAAADIDVPALVDQRRYVTLDAETVLELVMHGGVPDRARFQEVIGGALDGVGRHGAVHAFGELVALLWERGNVAGAVRVEELWNEIASTRSFRLLCGYPMSGFDRYPDPLAFEEVCRGHTEVVPAQSYSNATRSDGGFSRVVILEQKARTDHLEREGLRLKQARLEEALDRVSTLEDLRNEFLAMAVHDIRTPAAVVAGFLQVLRKNWRAFDEGTIEDLLSKGILQTQRIQQLVNDLLTVAEIDAGGFVFDIKPFDITAAIHEAVATAREASPDISFEVELPRLLRPALGDEGRQIQILNNLLSNAAKFSPPATSVTVKVAERSSDILVSVRDEGVGIAVADIPRVFKTFARLRPEGYEEVKGTGLGLYICKVLVEGQKGVIGIEPQTGRGTAVWYTVPKA